MALTREEFETHRDAIPIVSKEALEAGREYFNTGRRSALESIRSFCATLNQHSEKCEEWHAQG